MEKNPYNHTNSRKIVLYKELHAWEKGRDKWIQSQNSWSAQSCTLCQQSCKHSHSRRQKYLHIHFPPLRVLLTTFFSLLHCPQSFIGRSSTFLSILKFVSVQKLLLYGLFWGGFFAINRRKIKREKKEKIKIYASNMKYLKWTSCWRYTGSLSYFHPVLLPIFHKSIWIERGADL